MSQKVTAQVKSNSSTVSEHINDEITSSNAPRSSWNIYDIILLTIPSIIILTTLLTLLVNYPFIFGIASGCLINIIILVYAIFINPPL